MEKCIAGWKEIEYEVMRDHKGNVITVCNMENLDPVGVHTGDSIVVAPSQTLSDKEYQMLRTAALDIITELGIEGGCNCQFALKPDSFEYAVIEVNPRVSRSSALASKATGYPIAKVATKIAIGYTLDEITNDVTGKTCACFEPALDYIVVKYPKWPFDKFVYADKSLGTQMMATGEVMSIGNSFEAAMMKAVSSIELGMDTLTHKPFEELTDDEIVAHLHVQDAERVFCVYEALKRGIDHETIWKITKIDWWFLDKMQHLADLEKGLAKCNGVLSLEQYQTAKKYGFQDKTIKRLAQVDALPVENYRAGFKMVDTCAAEFSANTPYFYSTYDGDNEAAEFIAAREAEAAANGQPKKKKVLVFGSGPIRIGQGIEFDYCSVHCVWTLKKHGCEAILVNNNPETVSTDFDTGDRLYFDPLNPESVDNIIATEKPDACVVQFGGQTAIKLAKHMDEIGLPILGTPADAIDEAEDRERFDELLERCKIPRAPGRTVFNLDEALAAADEFELRTLCERIADQLIDEFVGAGQVDLMSRFAHPMPLFVMAALFGFGADEAAPLMQDLTDTVASDDGMAAHQRIVDRMRALIERKKQQPGADVPSRLLAHDAGFTDDEIVQDLLVVLTAAQQPTAYWIGNAIRLMLTDQRFAVTLSGGRRSVGQALNEVLWEDTPTQNFIGRFATRDTELGGKMIRTGDMLVMGFAGANTDPQIRPDSYNDSMGNHAHMSFGHGEHSCLQPGPEIGSIISSTAIEVLLDRLPDIALSVHPDELVWLPS